MQRYIQSIRLFLFFACACKVFFLYGQGQTSYIFDAGTYHSPVASDAERLTKSSNTSDFYWKNPNGLNHLDRAIGNDWNRDIVYATQPNTFETLVQNGEWEVVVTFGDTHGHDNIQVKAEGQIKLADVDVIANNYTDERFTVNVQDGKLTLEFSDQGGSNSHWVFAGLKLTKINTTTTTYAFDAGTYYSPVASSTERLTKSSNTSDFYWKNPNGLNHLDRAVGSDLNRDIVYSDRSNTLEVAVPNGEWEVVITFGDTHGHDNIQVKAEGQVKLADVDITANNYFDEDFIVNVQDGKLSLEFSDQGGNNPHWAFAGLKITSTGGSTSIQPPVVHYKMDQTPINLYAGIVDATLNTEATLTSNTNNNALPLKIAGSNSNSSNAWDFSNTDKYLKTLPSSTVASLGNKNTSTGLSIGFWVNLDYNHSLHNNRRIAGINGAIDIAMNSNGIALNLGGFAHQFSTLPAGTVLQGGWEHVVLTVDFNSTTNNFKWYHNGVLKGSQSSPITNSFNHTSNPLIIGARGNQSYYFPGKLDDFIIYDVALTDTQVAGLYGNGVVNSDGDNDNNDNPDDNDPNLQQGGFTEQWDTFTDSETQGLGKRTFNFDFAGMPLIRRAPAPYVHPRIYFNQEDIPEIKHRLENTDSGKAAMAQIHAHTTLIHLGYSTAPVAGKYYKGASFAKDPNGEHLIDNPGEWDRGNFYRLMIARDASFYNNSVYKQKRSRVLGFMTLEAFECLLYRGTTDSDTGLQYDDRAKDLAKAQAFLAEVVLARPNEVTPHDDKHREFSAVHMALAYDFNYWAMTDAQRDKVRRALAQITPDQPRYGKDLTCYVNLSNWNGLNSFEILGNLAIEGETGYKAQLTRDWFRNQHNFISYGWYPNGASNEGLGKNYMFVTTMLAGAKRGYSLLGHPHVKAYGTKFLPALMQPFGGSFTSNDVWGGSGGNPVTGGYRFKPTDMVGLKWIFPTDSNIDWVWRNYIQYDTNEGYQYAKMSPDAYHNYLVLGAIFARDYDDSKSFDNQAASVVKKDYFDPDRGLSVMRSGTDKQSLSTQFHCRQDLGGHTSGDRNDFTLSGLGRIWVRKTHGDPNFTSTYFHNCVLVNDKGVKLTYTNGAKARQPGKVIDYSDGNTLSSITGDATYAYSWQWAWSTKGATSTSKFLQPPHVGFEKVTESWNDFQYESKSEPHYNTPFYDYPDWITPERVEGMCKKMYNSMQRVVRSTAMVRGKHPFMLVVDDIQKDNNNHNYKWVAQIANDLVLDRTDVNLNNSNYRNDIILKEPSGTGNRRLLVRILNNTGQADSVPGRIEELIYQTDNGASFNPNPNYYRQRLVVESNSIAPDFRVLLYPHYAGDELPITSWHNNKTQLTVRFSDEERVLNLVPQENGRWKKIVLHSAKSQQGNQVQLSVKAYLQGALTDDGLMHSQLSSKGLLPNKEPFTALGYKHIGGGGETMAIRDKSKRKTIVDWIVLELRDENKPSNIIATRSALLQHDGNIVDVDGGSPVSFNHVKAGKYYVAVRHRNHLGVMTAEPILLE